MTRRARTDVPLSESELRLLVLALDERARCARWKSDETAARKLADRLFDAIPPEGKRRTT